MVNVAVIIDCYSPGEGKRSTSLESYHYNIIDSINRLKLDRVYLASYDIDPNELYQDNVFYTNTKNILNKEQWYAKEHFIKQPIRTSRKLTTCPIILNEKLYHPSIEKLTAHIPSEINDMQEIDKVYMFGVAYDVCLMTRPLGIPFWLDDKKDVRVTKNSTKYANQTYVDFNHLSNYEFMSQEAVPNWRLKYLYERTY
mgnify:FL=1|jgi:hypothetical protein